MRHARDGAGRPRRDRPARGFTLTELLVVMAIIGILIGFILVAAQDGIRRAEERATQSLIQKLESGVAERLEAILLRRADISLGHQVLAASFNPAFTPTNSTGDPNYYLVNVLSQYGPLASYPSYTTVIPTGIFNQQRAQAIAQFDLVRAELPDVFFVQTAVNPTYGARYPINFGGLDFPLGSGNYLVPLGAATTGTAPGQPNIAAAAPGDPNQAIGIFGATFQAAAGIYKNLGYLPQGYDGIDNPTSANPNGDGFVDDMAEGIGADPLIGDPDDPRSQVHLSALIQRRLAAHKHNTARSEMLYALLVEGVGPLGSVFSRDDFTNREVRDTDGDGLPEFVDAWGQPLQFYRWPLYYNNLSSTSLTWAAYPPSVPYPSGYVQKGMDPYNGPSEPRQLDPLDPNQTLTAPGWFSATVNSSNASGAYSYNAGLFMMNFHSLLDPNFGNSTLIQNTPSSLWDRGGFFNRRAYYSRFLVLSSGPDQTPGTAQVAMSTFANKVGPTVNDDVMRLTLIENQAAALDPTTRTGPLGSQPVSYTSPTQVTLDLLTAGGDDVTNHALASQTGGVR